MPELPEVETMRRGILPIVGSRIADVRTPRSSRRPITVSPKGTAFRRRVVGRQIEAVERAGKRVVVVLDSGDRIVIEPRMTGRIVLCEMRDSDFVRMVFDLNGAEDRQLLFCDVRGLGVVRLLSPRQYAARLGPEALGPDALTIDADTLRERLSASRRAIKVALLDQKAVAGIGNIYASEILHLAGIHPATTCRRLSRDQWFRLHAATGTVLEEAVRYEGSTLSDGAYMNARNERGGYQNHHRVYQRAGQKCRRCVDSQIVRLVQAQRSTFFCPGCQSWR